MLEGVSWKTVIAVLVLLFLLGMVAPKLRRKVVG
jgi:hypothetical protein